MKESVWLGYSSVVGFTPAVHVEAQGHPGLHCLKKEKEKKTSTPAPPKQTNRTQRRRKKINSYDGNLAPKVL